MGDQKTELLQGTLDVLLLKSLALGENHGLGIARRVRQISGGTFEVRPGSLFPALHRLAERGWLEARWGSSENGRRAKFYQLTTAGERQLETETENWNRIAQAMALALDAV